VNELAQIESVDTARLVLARADSVARVKSVIDRAEVIRAYARKFQRPDWLAWAEFKVDAARRAGDIAATAFQDGWIHIRSSQGGMDECPECIRNSFTSARKKPA